MAEKNRSIQVIRLSKRDHLYLIRKKLRHEEADARRSDLPKLQYNVPAIIDKLKTKASVSLAELRALQNGLLDDLHNVELLIYTHGALRGLVRELTGTDGQKQNAACGCLNNLALNDEKTCSIVAQAAGAYLVATLDSLSAPLAENCAYTLGNLMNSGRECCEILLGLGAIKLCDVTLDRVKQGAVYALCHLVHVMGDDLLLDHLEKILELLSRLEITKWTARLLFLCSCHKNFTHHAIPEEYLEQIVEKIPAIIKKHVEALKENPRAKENNLVLTLLLRTLANINNNKVYKSLIIYFLENNMAETFKMLLKEDNHSVWWFLGNTLMQCGEGNFYKTLRKWFQQLQ